jgi:hypothetical protein
VIQQISTKRKTSPIFLYRNRRGNSPSSPPQHSAMLPMQPPPHKRREPPAAGIFPIGDTMSAARWPREAMAQTPPVWFSDDVHEFHNMDA